MLEPNAEQGIGEFTPVPSVALLIGPEGGLDLREQILAREHGFQALRLGPRVLRTETAALAAITVLQSRWGDLT
ncbi:MAG: RsmE family RNA methyltransferase [Candidatus Macondimonas sp.]